MPGAQSTHRARPVEAATVPLEHVDSAPDPAGQKWPLVQMDGAEECRGQKEPAGHWAQSPTAAAPGEERYVPAGQDTWVALVDPAGQ